MSDKAWFQENLDANFRLRAPNPGEVEDIARRMLPKGVDFDGAFEPPKDQIAWGVLVVKLAPKSFVRFLTGLTGGEKDGIGVYAIGLGARLAIDEGGR